MNKSVYDAPSGSDPIKRYIITILVDNEPGVLARVVGMFSGRGYNIDSLNVAEVAANENLSRITIVTHGTSEVIDLIRKQLMSIVPVHSVTNLEQEGSPVEAEVALIYLEIDDSNKKDVYNIYENELHPKNVEEDEGIKDYTEFDGINDDWEEFNERDFSAKKNT